jgi:DNA-binding CsgD family transcriptional regulator
VLDVQLNDGGMRRMSGDKVFINIGSHAAMPSVPGLATAQPLTHIEALDLDYVPSHLRVLGAGYVGLELAQAYRRFGSQVTVIETGEQIMSREDPVAVQGRSGEGICLTANTLAGTQTIEASDILVAIGRIANTADIGLDAAGVALDARGYIRVNDRLETTAPEVWAIGECAGSPQFTHVSVDDFRIIRDNLAGGARSTVGDVLLGAVRHALTRSHTALRHEAQLSVLRDRYVSLSLRQREVMALVVSGRLNKQVAGELGISEITVKSHRGKMMRKMKADSVADLINMSAGLRITPEQQGSIARRVDIEAPRPFLHVTAQR